MAKPNPETIRMCAEGLRNQIETNADIEDVEQRERRNAYIALLDCAAFLDSLPPMQPNARNQAPARSDGRLD